MSEPATSPYLSLRQAVRPGICAHRLLAQDAERAGQLVADCEELLLLTRKLLQASGLVHILAPEPGEHEPGEHEPGEHGPGEHGPGEHEAGRHERFLDAYADAGLLWAKVVGSSMVLAGALLEAGDWENVRLLAGSLADAGEAGPAADVRAQLAKAVLAAHHEQLSGISNKMPPEEIGPAIKALRAMLTEVPGDLNREVNRLLVPLAASINAIMRQRDIDVPFTSRVEHIATGGVAKYPDIVTISLDEIAAEFEGLC
jgi:hypothetical protein